MPNNNPIFSRVGDIQGGIFLSNTVSTIDYSGQTISNRIVYSADQTNGGFLQRLRFKANGTNTTATVARVWFNDGNISLQAIIGNVASAPTGSSSTSGGTLLTGTYYAQVAAVDQYGQTGNVSAESTGVATTGNTSSITWNWTPVAGAASYRLWTGDRPGGETLYFNTSGNVAYYVQTLANVNPTTNYPAQAQPADTATTNYFFGEISLPATTASTTSATVDIDYPINVALPPGYHVLVGLGANVTGGWYVTSIGGRY